MAFSRTVVTAFFVALASARSVSAEDAGLEAGPLADGFEGTLEQICAAIARPRNGDGERTLDSCALTDTVLPGFRVLETREACVAREHVLVDARADVLRVVSWLDTRDDSCRGFWEDRYSVMHAEQTTIGSHSVVKLYSATHFTSYLLGETTETEDSGEQVLFCVDDDPSLRALRCVASLTVAQGGAEWRHVEDASGADTRTLVARWHYRVAFALDPSGRVRVSPRVGTWPPNESAGWGRSFSLW